MEYPIGATSVFSFDLHQTFAECARSNGVELWPDPVWSPRGTPHVPDELRRLALQAATEEDQARMIDVCVPMMDQAEAAFFDAHGDEYNDRYQVVVHCMRDRGYLVDDPGRLTSFDENVFLNGPDVTDEMIADFNDCAQSLYDGWLDVRSSSSS